MGGRGSTSEWKTVTRRAGVMKMPEGYTVITSETVRAGEAYPFFEASGRRWSLVSVPLEGEVRIHPSHRLGMEEPTLVWFSDNDRKELYVDGMTTREFGGAVGLEFSLHKGAAVLSKRMSRVLRPYRSWGWFDAGAVQVGYLDQTPRAAKVWDGAGLVDRKMLAKLPVPEGIDPERASAWRRRLMREGRVEFTIQHAGGQDKGHAIVTKNLRDDAGNLVDFLLPQDTKQEVVLTDGVFVGINPVHGKDDLRLDIQSFINLNGFFGQEQVVEGARAELNLFEAAVATNHLEEIGMQLGGREAGAGQAWPLQAFWEAGGDIRWSPHLIKAVFDQHLRRLEASAADKVRLPQAGGRYYVMPAGVGRRGGLDLVIARGEVHVDPEHATAWVNDTDWLSLSGERMEGYEDGIAAVLGGADNDDGLWLAPFEDVPLKREGEGQAEQAVRRFLVWRSPNNLGEYVVLKPTPNSHIPQWHGVEVWQKRDSTLLPVRADRQQITYLNMVDHEQVGNMGQGEDYSTEMMLGVSPVLLRNQGGLELYCNTLLRHVAMYGGLPAVAPARLEDVVDSKKTGADVSGMKQWCYEDTNVALARGDRVPRRLLGRLARERGRDALALDPPPVLTGERDGHWLDRFDRAWKGHVRQVEQARDRLMAEARPPEALFAAVALDPQSLAAGARFNQLYATTVKRLQKKEFGGRQKDIRERVVQEVEQEMSRYSLEERRQLLVKWAFEKAWRKAAQERGNGGMDADAYMEAVQAAREGVDQLDEMAVTGEVRGRLTKQVARRVEQEQKRGLSKEALDEVRETMEQFLAQWTEDGQKAVLRGAIASVFLNERRKAGGDADGVWLMGKVQADGTRAAGIANKTLQAFEEIGVLGMSWEQVVREALMPEG